MPAMLDDPTSAPIAREVLQPTLTPLIVTLKDGTTKATIIPFTSVTQVPPRLINYLWSQMSLEIEKGDTYPMAEPLPLSTFGPYWFAKFAAVMLLGEHGSVADVTAMDAAEDVEWEKVCLGTFYIKPNYPGRSSHVCNAGFIVTAASRNRGVGKLLGKAYLEWAPKLGYTYSVFNLVYETNVASCKIWDSLGFERIGRVKKCGKLKSYPGKRIDAIVFGYDFEPDLTE